MMFEWDENKNRLNNRKHGISFEEAGGIFKKRFLAKKDTRKDYGEERFNAYGIVNGKILHVTYVRRGGNIRIISARFANHIERRTFRQWLAEQED